MKKSVKTSTVVIYGFLVLAVGVFILTLFWNEINTTSDKILHIIPMIGFVLTLIVTITFVAVIVGAIVVQRNYSPDKKAVNRLNVMNVFGVILWGGPSIYLYLREWFRPEDRSTNSALEVGFIFFSIALCYLLWKIGKQPGMPATKWLGITCVTMVLVVAISMTAFPLFYSLSLNRMHQNSGLRDIPLSEVVNTTYPGDHFALKTMIKTPTLNGEAELGHGNIYFWVDPASMKTQWPAGDAGVITGNSLRYVDYVSDIKDYFTAEITVTGVFPSTNEIIAELIIPPDDTSAPFQVTGHLGFNARYYKVVDHISDSRHSGHYDTDIGSLESQNISFWVYPKMMGSEITKEREMYQHTTVQSPELIIAGSALIPLIFMLIGLNYKKKVRK